MSKEQLNEAAAPAFAGSDDDHHEANSAWVKASDMLKSVKGMVHGDNKKAIIQRLADALASALDGDKNETKDTPDPADPTPADKHDKTPASSVEQPKVELAAAPSTTPVEIPFNFKVHEARFIHKNLYDTYMLTLNEDGVRLFDSKGMPRQLNEVLYMLKLVEGNDARADNLTRIVFEHKEKTAEELLVALKDFTKLDWSLEKRSLADQFTLSIKRFKDLAGL